MRLHQLTVVAFGPFAEQVSVDFDALSEAGLFLLTGDTGSGKSSVLDAVCFALYGEVPGDRALARRLRSDHAAPGVGPEVTLEFSARGRRFRLVRSPAWIRPKLRGEGTTQVPARVVCQELIAGQWQPVSHRIDEVGHLMRRLLGLTMNQFVQVAMLPQGQFQAFLRATSDERHRLLQQLFQTDRFERIETWLREHRRELSRASASHQAEVAALLHRVCEGAGVELPAEWAEPESWVRAAGLTGWLDALQQSLQGQRDDAVAAHTSSEAKASAARARLAALRLQHEHRTVGEQAQSWLSHADAQAEEITRAHERVEAARRSAELHPWRDIVAQGRRHLDGAQRGAVAARESVSMLLGYDVDDLILEAVHQAATSRVHELGGLVPVSQRFADLTKRRSAALSHDSSLVEQLEAARASAARAPEQVARAAARVTAAREAELALPAAETRLVSLRARLAAHQRALALADELTRANAALSDAKTALHAHTENWLHVREARLEGMAAEMAQALAAGCACPVCGSADHPRPAQASSAAPDRAAERAARALVDDAEIVLQACTDTVNGLTSQLQLELAAAGDPAEITDPAVLADAEARREATRSLASTHDDAQQALRQAEATQAAQLAALHELEEAHAASRSRLSLLDDELREAEHTLRSALPDPHRLASVLDDCRELASASRQAVAACERADQSRVMAEDAVAEADRQAQARGFVRLSDADAALIPDDELQALRTRLADHAQQCRQALEVLERSEVRDALALPAPDLASASHDAQRAAEHATASATNLDRLHRALERTHELALAAQREVSAWLPVLEALDVATSLSAFVEGKSPDNQLAMRLSAFVLGHRLSQVVAAANDRLAPMSDQRFALTHSEVRGAGERRGGLSLLVHDEWSGETRDPTTLSGGETFVVSLALALGLADVIAHEAGGADLETLFVDEGFGSLDGDTLDQVLDVLDSLREGGRTVGVVSHVAEMRDRIPTRLHVHKARSGSSLSLELA